MPEKIESILKKYSRGQDELIPVLQGVQKEFGYVAPESVKKISRYLRITENQIYGVSSFYAQFRFTPPGQHLIKACRGTACHVRGAQRILEEVKKQLGITEGETTPDLEYSLETVACIGCCALAPCIMINEEVHGRLSDKGVANIFSKKGTEGESDDAN
jgi:NADH-quinone oxidoreductase subunit E